MTVSVLVPFGSSCEWRIRAWGWVRDRYRRLHPDWEVVVGGCDDEWSKGGAVEAAYQRANGDALVLADADSFIDAAVLVESVELLADHQWVVPHTRVRRLTRKATRAVLDGAKPHPHQLARSAYVGVVGGGITVLRRSAYETVGGIDPRFEGWGGEDISFGWALETLVGEPRRLDGDLYHLWHPHAAPRRRGTPASEALAGAYRDARGDLAAMGALVAREEGCLPCRTTSNPYERDSHRRSTAGA